jgi:hypothetical protein
VSRIVRIVIFEQNHGTTFREYLRAALIHVEAYDLHRAADGDLVIASRDPAAAVERDEDIKLGSVLPYLIGFNWIVLHEWPPRQKGRLEGLAGSFPVAGSRVTRS